MSIDDRISRLEQRLGLVEEDDQVVFVFYTGGIDGPILPGQETATATTVRWTASGEHITAYGPEWAGTRIGPGTKLYRDIDPRRI